MSYRAQVTATPQQLAYGSQVDNLTLTNVGANTVYLANDSSVTANSDLVLDAGGSILVEPKTVIWGVCQAGLTSQVAVTASVGERFAYSNQSYKVISQTTVTDLGPGYGTGNFYQGNITFDSSFSTQYAAIGIWVKSVSAPPAGNINFTWNNTNTISQYAMSHLGTNQFFNGGAIFPVSGFGGSWQVQADVLIGKATITIIGYPNSFVPYPTVYNNPPNLLSGWNGSSGAWTLNAGAKGVSTSTQFYLPAMTGSARVTLNYSQTTAGNVVITPNAIRTVSGVYWVATPIQYDTATITTTVNSQLVIYNWNNIPPMPIYLQVNTDATATLNSLYISVDQNKLE